MAKSYHMFDAHADTVHFLKRLNADLMEIIQIAEMDFVKVNHVVRSLYEQSMKQSDTNHDSRINLDTMMTGLQYMDVLNQRIQHLMVTHDKMLLFLDSRKSFFHLHVFQSQTIRLDLLHSISSIQQSLTELKALGTGDIFFSNTSLLDKALQKTIDLLVRAGGDIHQLPIPPLTEEQAQLLSSLYTMDKERIVLNWFRQATTLGTWDDLIQHYHAQVNTSETESIELF